SGFRDKAELLPYVFLRMGVLAALRSLATGRTVGLIATASHNLPEDNGIKLVDPDGGMLAQAWEVHAQTLADAATPTEFSAALATVMIAAGLRLEDLRRGGGGDSGKWAGGGGDVCGCCGGGRKPTVFVARDTRETGPALLKLAVKGATAVCDVEILNCGVLSTPVLHYWVRMANLAAEGASCGGGLPGTGRWLWRWRNPGTAADHDAHPDLALGCYRGRMSYEADRADSRRRFGDGGSGAGNGCGDDFGDTLGNGGDGGDGGKPSRESGGSGGRNDRSRSGCEEGAGLSGILSLREMPGVLNSDPAGYFRMLGTAYHRLLRIPVGGDVAEPGPPPGPPLLRRGDDDDGQPLVVDAACGVGGYMVALLARSMRETCGDGLRVELRNMPGEGRLNVGCGAEHVQKKREPPRRFEGPAAGTSASATAVAAAAAAGQNSNVGRRACSLDGDGDRIVFHYYDQGGGWHLLDGDKIAALVSSFLLEELQAAHLLELPSAAVGNSGSGNSLNCGAGRGTATAAAAATAGVDGPAGIPAAEPSAGKRAAAAATRLKTALLAGEVAPAHLSFAVVQTAYANGGATEYMRRRGIKIAVAKTGVKFLHHEAVKLDIGVYFEANGHGTVLFGDLCTAVLRRRLRELHVLRERRKRTAVLSERRPLTGSDSNGGTGSDPGGWTADPEAVARATLAVERLLLTRDLVNQAVGDAISDLLLVEVWF
ncbi:unnamed protein product, partial [Phaeothamnion confervicola]